MPDATTTHSVMDTLWPVIVGGAIGILAGFGGPVFLRSAPTDRAGEEASRRQAQELHTELFEIQSWLETIRTLKFWGKDTPIGISPVSNILRYRIHLFSGTA